MVKYHTKFASSGLAFWPKKPLTTFGIEQQQYRLQQLAGNDTFIALYYTIWPLPTTYFKIVCYYSFLATSAFLLFSYLLLRSCSEMQEIKVQYVAYLGLFQSGN
jgi:hypothetical protein